ncbi:MAG: RnfABCDGE type electron transport complex subunit D [Nitrospirae bacterium]|nr:RnfABCDGE type electron transport complex subunit D [Nitrospirota bacterium]MBF0533899.1 RnfABCDGE type electron transport complex subunit D [Nitrospirota bacterium]MBF0615392.1 RnfABCDGE type electron transport complex subunit D [Nitrospirota bacterium]
MEAGKENKLIVSVSPHIKSSESVDKIMWTVTATLLPTFVMGVYYFGPKAVIVTLLCIIGSLLSEYFVQKLAGKDISLKDGSAVLTGLLLGMNMPSTLPFYIPLLSSFVAVAITKQLFGGLGYNVFNPALMGRAFALITWPRAMTTWAQPIANFTGMDAKTTATPLGILKEQGLDKLLEVFGSKMHLYSELLLGHRAGSLGETSVIAILIGAAFLLLRGYITLRIPAAFLASVAAGAWVFGGKQGIFTGDPLVHVLSGGLMLGAFYMATDYVTCPTTKKGQMLFGAGCGLLTILIRLKAGYPEGVMFSILIMNCFTPLIDRGFRTEVFGAKKKA